MCFSLFFHRPLRIINQSIQNRTRKNNLKNFWASRKKALMRRVILRQRMRFYESSQFAKIKLNKRKREYKLMKYITTKAWENSKSNMKKREGRKKERQEQSQQQTPCYKKTILKQFRTERETRRNRRKQKQRNHTQQ